MLHPRPFHIVDPPPWATLHNFIQSNYFLTARALYVASIESLLSDLHSQDQEHDTVETTQGILQAIIKSW